MSTELRPVLDAEAERRVELLMDGYELGSGFDLAAVVGPSEAARSEVAARLAALGPMLRLPPSGRVLADLEARLGELGEGRPILWVEADALDLDAWSAALAAMNSHREWLRHEFPGLVVLAGPSELLPLSLERPDLGTMMGTVVRVTHDPRPASSGVVRWLHLSDLHFTATQRWDRRNVSQSLLRYLAGEVADQGLTPDLVLVTGDIAQSGQPAEYDQAELFLRALMDTLGLDPRQHLFLVPGNHDVDRDRINRLSRLLVDDLREQGEQSALSDALGDAGELTAMGERLEAFYAFTRRLLGDARGWSATRPWRADVAEVAGIPVGLVQLNTAWAAGTDEDKGTLLVGVAQVEGALAELADARVKLALMHHPTSCLADFDEERVDDLLTSGRGVDLVLRGHLHQSRVAMELAPGAQTGTLAAGATYQASPWHKGCLLTELDLDEGRGRVHLLGYSDRSGGFWHPDPSACPAAKDGVWSFDLPPHLRPTAPAAPDTATAPPPEDAPAVRQARVDRYRAACVAVHGAVSFLGLPEKSRHVPRTTIDKLFAPLDIAEDRSAGPDHGGGTSVERLLERLLRLDGHARRATAPRVVLLGDPGSGKTTLTRFLAVWAAGGVDLDGVDRPADLVPLRIPFREMNRATRTDLLGFLEVQSREALAAPRDRSFFERLLGEGRALVLLDGLDEVPPGDRAAANAALLGFATSWPATPMLVTSRVVGYDAAPLPASGASPTVVGDSRPTFHHLRLRPLSDDGLSILVRRWYAAREPDARERERLTADLLARLERSPRARHLARTPLLATLICLVHGQRATLPGQRAKLYELVVDTLLHTWEEARGGRFAEIDAGRQRRYLEELALVMQRRRVEGGARDRSSPAEITIAEGDLVATLTRIACAGRSTEDEATVHHRMGRWVAWLTARTGLLVEQRPGAYGFLHLTLMEYLAACALDRRGGVQLARELRDLADQSAWHETVLLVAGRRAESPQFAAELFDALHRHSPACDVLLLQALREELDLSDEARCAIVEAALVQRDVVPTLVTIVRYSDRHAEGVRRATVAYLEAAAAPLGVPDGLLEVLLELVDEPQPALALVRELAAKTSDGDHLYWLWEATEQAAQRWPEVRAAAESVCAGLFDHLAEPPRELFETLETVHDGPKPYWCEVPAGTFMMGSPADDSDSHANERPQHEVTLSEGFLLGAAPVTNRQYRVFAPDGRAAEFMLDHPEGV